MKIALLSEKYTPDIGGLAISVGRLARLLTSAGHKVRVFAPTPNLPPSDKRTLPSAGVSITRFGVHKRVDDTLVDWFEIVVEEHGRNPFDVLHAYFLPLAGFAAAYSGEYLNIPSVVSIRGNDIERAAFDPGKFSHVMYALQHASAVTTNAGVLARKAKTFVDREIDLIPNGIDTDHFKPAPKNDALMNSIGIQKNVIRSEAKDPLPIERESSIASHSQSDPLPVIGFVGELREKKGLKTLLSAYTQVNKRQPAILLIVGDIRQGGDKQIFDEFQLSNPNSLIFVTGYIPPDDLPVYYSLMDVFVHPSLRDGMPNAVLEAMACERPVIVTPVGGVPDFLEDGVNGVLVPINNADQLAKKILELLGDSTLRLRLGEHARTTIINKFSPEKELQANLDVYRKLGLRP